MGARCDWYAHSLLLLLLLLLHLAVCRIPITFISMDGANWTVDGVEGETLLETIRRFNLPVPGTDADMQ